MNILLPVSTIMTSDLITLGPKDTLEKVKEVFEKNRIHHIPIVKFNTIVGMISKSDYLAFSRGFRSPSDRFLEEVRHQNWIVADIMTTGLAKVAPNEPIRTALEVFKKNRFHALPICEEDKLVGLLTTFDIIDFVSKEEIKLEDYSAMTTQ